MLVCLYISLEFYNKNGGKNALLVTMLFFANLLHKLTHLVRIGSDSVIVFIFYFVFFVLDLLLLFYFIISLFYYYYFISHYLIMSVYYYIIIR